MVSRLIGADVMTGKRSRFNGPQDASHKVHQHRLVLEEAREVVKTWLADGRTAFNVPDESIDRVVERILTIANR